MKKIETKKITFYCREPSSTPPAKTVFFFSLSAEDSLTLPPFCHPVDTLVENGCRVLSAILPGHENNEKPLNIQKLWKEQISHLKIFIEDLAVSVKELTEIFPPPYGAMGISRGAFIALHLAARQEEVTSITCFAPLLSLPETKDLSISNLVPKLLDKNIHFFVGHKDELIGTENVIALSSNLIDSSRGSKHRKKLEIYTKISPSIGRGGHGTSDNIFKEGALWLQNIL